MHLLRAFRNHRFLLLLALGLAACGRLPVGQTTAVLPPLILEPPPDHAAETLAALQAASPPPRDLADLAQRYRRLVEIPAVASDIPPGYQVGDVAPFWYKDSDNNSNHQVDARLAYRSEQLNMWVDVRVRVDDARLAAAAARLEAEILPTSRLYFGTEARPGIDGDDRLNVLHLQNAGATVAGYFSQADQFVTAVNPYSNQRHLLYVNLANAPVDSNDYYRVVAHELQHLIQWHTDPNEAIWLNEGLGELAAFVNGLGPSPFVDHYARQTDVQLNRFNYDGEIAGAHYGAAFLFVAYFLDRFGEATLRDLVRNPAYGEAGIESTLAARSAAAISFDALFADWLVANYLDARRPGSDQFRYEALELPRLQYAAEHQRFPVQRQTAVRQYGADYIRLAGDRPLTVTFTGTQQIPVLDTAPRSGQWFWTSYPADSSTMTLSRSFDLAGVSDATLQFWTWYEIESGWDYVYVAASTDGRFWEPLETVATTRFNPQGNSYGPGFSGVSGGGAAPVWIEQSADLSPYTGQSVTIRFEYVTDDAVHLQGFALDDVAIPEIGYADSFETGDGGWTAAGFVRHSNVLPQRFILQALLLGPDSYRVKTLPLSDNRGQWTLPLGPVDRGGEGFDEAILIVAGATPFTGQPAGYAYEVRR